jgi:hypothetical protein
MQEGKNKYGEDKEESGIGRKVDHSTNLHSKLICCYFERTLK